MIKKLLNESLISVYNNYNINEGYEDHPEAKAKCLTPQALADDMNKELGRINTVAKDRVSRGVKDVIYHKKQIQSVINQEGGLDVDKFKTLITTPPKLIFDKNPKMEKSDKGKSQFTVNTGLPAISGIVYDESDGQFKHINTCPGAGSCQLVCYARKGFYGMNDGKILKLIRRLNLLWNNPEEYYHMIMDELEPIAVKLKRQGRRSGEVEQLVIRWNDAGDFFSETYFNIAKKVTEDLLSEGYDVKSYAYTKQAKFVNLASDDFIMNFSKGSAPKELKQVDLEKVKYSDIVPKELFKQIFKWKGPHAVKDENGLPTFEDGGKEKLKQIISKEYGVTLNRLKYQFELPNEEGEKFKYDVIVLPTGDSDIGAQRNDVQKTFLLVH
jgi:hypothetical protein|tara:strand:+ start:2650 stop:3798 length:1149 start_codon:yes stop_codon:yes gene_type:complete